MTVLPGGISYQQLSADERVRARQLAKEPGGRASSRVTDGAVGWLRWLAAMYFIVAAVLLIAGAILFEAKGAAGVLVLILAIVDAAFGWQCLARSVRMAKGVAHTST